MANEQNSRFTNFAGTQVARGIGTDMPLVALESSVDATVIANLNTINGLMPKIADVFIRETRVFASPLDPYITVYDERFGIGIEQFAFKVGAQNHKRDGTCVGRGTPEGVAQIDLSNIAYNVTVDVKDREVNKGVLNEGQAGAYIAEKLRTPLKTISSLFYRAWIEKLSDVVDGSRSLSSHVSGNGLTYPNGSASVSYQPTIEGYAGVVEKRNEVLPALAAGVQYEIATPLDALNILNRIKSMVADFAFESNQFNKLGIDTFTTGVPLLIMERKVLDAMDTVFAEYNAKGNGNGNFGYAGFPSVTAREYARQFAELVEIDAFADLPTSAADAEVKYTGYGLHAVLIDRDALIRVNHWADVEGQRCSQERLTGYSFAGEATLAIWKGVNSYAMVFRQGGAVTFESGHFDVEDASGDAITSGDMVAPGALVTVSGGTGYNLATVTLNGTSLTIGADDSVTFPMPQGDAVIVVTTTSERGENHGSQGLDNRPTP